MFSTDWHTSKREYGVTIERNVDIPVGNGVALKADGSVDEAETARLRTKVAAVARSGRMRPPTHRPRHQLVQPQPTRTE